MKLSVLSVVAALVLSGPAIAGGVLYDCTVKQTSGPDGWISTRTAIIIDDAGAGQVINALTLHFETGPRPVRVRKRGETLRLTWSFTGLTDRANSSFPKFTYLATLDPKSGSFKVRGKPAGVPQGFSGSGSCVTRKNLSTRELNRLLRG